VPKDVHGIMDEWKKGQLHSGKHGPVVTSQKQAVAIALSEKRKRESVPGMMQTRQDLRAIRSSTLPKKK